MAQIIIDNLLIEYSQFGKQGGPTVLFLHGWRSNKEVWRDVIERLKNENIEGLSLAAVDLPGFGKSQLPPRTFRVGDYAEVVRVFIEKLDLANVIIVGHSFGGRVGIKLASKYPSLIKKLILVDSAGFSMDQGKKSIMGMTAKLVKPFFKPAFMQPLRKRIYRMIGSEDYIATPELQPTYVKVISEDLTEDMKKIICPTLIVYGENDLDTPVEFGKRMQSLIPNSNFTILKNAGHFSFLDKPEEFITSIVEFL